MSDIRKLPKWAQGKIRDLERERDVAIKALNKYCDSQTPAPFYVEEWESTGERQGPSTKRRYIHAHHIEVVYAGVHLNVSIKPYSSTEDDAIFLQWQGENRASDDIAMIPGSHCRVRLVTKENMR